MSIVRKGYAVVRLTVIVQLEDIQLEERAMSAQEQEDILVKAINEKYPGLINLSSMNSKEVDEVSELDVIELDYSD